MSSISKPINIAMLTDCYSGKFIGGGQIHIKNLVLNLEKNHNCKIKIFSQKNSNILIRFFWSIWVIPQAIISNLKNHFDLIHSHGYIPGLSAKIISLILHIPVIHTVHGSNLIDQNLKSVKAKLENYLLTKIKYDAQIIVNENFLKYKNKTKNQIVIPNGVNLPKKNHQSSIINHEQLNILFIGRLEKIKGIDILVKTLVKLKNENWNLTIIGNGSQKNELISLVQKSKLTNKIIFQNSQIKLSKYYKKADIFVLPSISEGQPITILEAWSFKLPVIATMVGSNPFIIKDKIDGILVSPKNVDSLKNAIKWIFNNKKKAQEMGKKGFSKIKKNFTWNKIAQKTFFVYQSVLSNHHSEAEPKNLSK